VKSYRARTGSQHVDFDNLHPSTHQTAWVDFVKNCEVMNVANVSGTVVLVAGWWDKVNQACLSVQMHGDQPTTPHAAHHAPPPALPFINAPFLPQQPNQTTQRAGEAEAATVRKPSCMPDFSSMADFEQFVGASAKAASAAASGSLAPLALAAAAAGVLAMAL